VDALPPDLAARLARLESALSPDGTLRCERLVIMGAHGTPRIVASVSESGEAMLEMLDSGQVRRITVSARADGSAGMLLADGRGRTRIGLGTTAGGEAHLACVDAAGKPRITVGTSGNAGAEVPGGPAGAPGGAAGGGAAGGGAAGGGAAIALIDEHGATRISIRSTNGDALLTFADRDRRVRMSAGTCSDGTVIVPTDSADP
jgi:hypothetical protein